MDSKLDSINLQQRKIECQKIMQSHPNQIPIILENDKEINDSKTMENRFLVPKRFKFQEFIFNLRKNMNLPKTSALFISIGGHLPALDKTMISIYDEFKNPDGFLYVRYSSESALG
ncbi:unnamed protein product [Blepharisma stoltei]|uniref:Autophagy-related protein n=1 Tax=Blepharisma stoltei TaxID=1481888 RepID=A0AAU9IBS5_9CILI|nr:unnamed protein product [Blepharisma stoltei]